MFLKLYRYVKDLLNIGYVTNQLEFQELWNIRLQSDPCTFKHVPDKYKTQKICNEAVQSDPWMLKHVPDQYKTQEMCNEAVKKSPCALRFAPDQFVTQKMRDAIVKKSPCALWCYKGYEQRKAQKAKIKEELMSVAWHPDRWWNWCVPEDEKKELEIYFA